ncbi:MAG TPA: hypothetical protein VIH08_06475, partial [Blastococcus sp.]
ARAAPAEEVFAAVTAEVGRLLAVDVTGLARYDPDACSGMQVPWIDPWRMLRDEGRGIARSWNGADLRRSS